MESAKRIELIVANVILEKVLFILDEVGVNYTVFKDISGKGNHGSKKGEGSRFLKPFARLVWRTSASCLVSDFRFLWSLKSESQTIVPIPAVGD
jgi:nitrogen regulatory protein PII